MFRLSEFPEEDPSFYGNNFFSCRPSYRAQLNEEGVPIDPYEPYNETVFEANEENILDDATYIYDYVSQVLGIEDENIIIFGRSMGTGPATHVAAKRRPAALMLMSSFKSIRAIAEDQAGSLLKYLIQDRFNNLAKIKDVRCPTFLVHGMKDNLIPYSHSKALHEECGGPCSIVIPSKMDHNNFDFIEDLITPFYHFLRQFGISTKEPIRAHRQMEIPSEYFIIPKAYQHKAVGFSYGCYCLPVHNVIGPTRISVQGGADIEGNPVNNLN
mmetsp:Transcript_9693/g.14755  ORF Transcript_9693/g.14755 Transcript_9693/m.14755 type:complete len:270 (+) Transcript_9693:987-1796(+)